MVLNFKKSIVNSINESSKKKNLKFLTWEQQEGEGVFNGYTCDMTQIYGVL